MEAKSETNKQISSFLFILWAGGAALLSYSLVYALRKPFTAATFDGMDFFGMDYKVATTIMQIFGYLISKFFAIKIVSELKREDRLKFMVYSVALAELALVFFGLLPQPFNVFALFFNGLALGCMWGVIFSFIEGRKVTDILASLLGVSMAVSSGMAKSMGLFVVNTFGVTEFWMPALIGGLAFPLLILMGWSLNKLPQPTDEDRALRSERVTLNGEQRRQLFKSYMPLLIMLFFANLFITILRDIKEDFLVNIIDVSTISSWLFAQVDGMVTLIILGIFAMMSLINSNYRVLQVLLAMVIGGAGTISYLAFNYDALQLPTLYWLFLQSLSLYIVYLSFQTLFFERFIACFKIKGNVGFFIATIDFIGYTGTVCVLLFKEFCSPDINWMEFYNQFSGWVGIVCSIAFIGSAIYLMQRYKLEKQLRKEEKNKKEIQIMENIVELQKIIQENEFFQWLIVTIISAIVFSATNLFFVSNILKIEITRGKKIKIIILEVISRVSTAIIIPVPYYRALTIIVSIVILRKIVKASIEKCIVAESINAISFICAEVIFSKVGCMIFKDVETYQKGMSDPMYKFYLTSSIAILSLIHI